MELLVKIKQNITRALFPNSIAFASSQLSSTSHLLLSDSLLCLHFVLSYWDECVIFWATGRDFSFCLLAPGRLKKGPTWTGPGPGSLLEWKSINRILSQSLRREPERAAPLSRPLTSVDGVNHSWHYIRQTPCEGLRVRSTESFPPG